MAAVVEAPIAGGAAALGALGRHQTKLRDKQQAQDERDVIAEAKLSKEEAKEQLVLAKAMAKIRKQISDDQESIRNGTAVNNYKIKLDRYKADTERLSEESRLIAPEELEAAKRGRREALGKIEISGSDDLKTLAKMKRLRDTAASDTDIALEGKYEGDLVAESVEAVRTLENAAGTRIFDSDSLFREIDGIAEVVEESALGQKLRDKTNARFEKEAYSALIKRMETDGRFDEADELLADPRAADFVDSEERVRLEDRVKNGRKEAELSLKLTKEDAQLFLAVAKGDTSVDYNPKRDKVKFNRFFNEFLLKDIPDPDVDPEGYANAMAQVTSVYGTVPDHALGRISRALRSSSASPDQVVEAAQLYDKVTGKNPTILGQIPGAEQQFADNVLALTSLSSGLTNLEAVESTRKSQSLAEDERTVREARYKKLIDGRGSSQTNAEFLNSQRGKIDVPRFFFDAKVVIPANMQGSFDRLVRAHFLAYGEGEAGLAAARKWALRKTFENWYPSSVEDEPRWMTNSPERTYAPLGFTSEELRADFVETMTGVNESGEKLYPGYDKDPDLFKLELDPSTVDSTLGPGFFIFEVNDLGVPQKLLGVSEVTGSIVPHIWRPGGKLEVRDRIEAPKKTGSRVERNKEALELLRLQEEREDEAIEARSSGLKSFVSQLGGN